MAILVSPGTSVTVTNESFFIPAAASTVPLIFITSADEKKQPDGVTPAAGTYEYGVVRAISSLQQSTTLYGVPKFLIDTNGRAHHGDSRNEYGLFALNQFLGIGDLAYVVRANVNTNDNTIDVRNMWNAKMQEAAFVLENVSNTYINEFNLSNGYISTNPLFKSTLTRAELLSLNAQATASTWARFSFSTVQVDFTSDQTLSPLSIFANGYNVAATGTFAGFTGLAIAYETGGLGAVVPTQWTPAEAAQLLLAAADAFKFTTTFLNKTSLGANDAARRVAIVTALQAVVNSNTEIRSEAMEFNLILCPGFHEVADELLTLSIDIQEEALVIADTPMNLSPEAVVTWSATSERRSSPNVTYYYPPALASNLDGVNVVVPASSVALRTITYSDKTSFPWIPPAGTRRGLVSGVSAVGYVTGTLGTPTTFVESSLNLGQRNNLYKYFTNINPIVFFPGRGLIVWGQKTSAPDASALDRINVARLIMYVRRQLRKNTMSFIFEPNDQLTRDNLKATVDAFLGDLIVKRGLYDFATICSDKNNTPDRIDRNEMYIDIALKPVKAAEFLYIPIRIVSTGAQIH